MLEWLYSKEEKSITKENCNTLFPPNQNSLELLLLQHAQLKDNWDSPENDGKIFGSDSIDIVNLRNKYPFLIGTLLNKLDIVVTYNYPNKKDPYARILKDPVSHQARIYVHEKFPAPTRRFLVALLVGYYVHYVEDLNKEPIKLVYSLNNMDEIALEKRSVVNQFAISLLVPDMVFRAKYLEYENKINDIDKMSNTFLRVVRDLADEFLVADEIIFMQAIKLGLITHRYE